jgi:starch synthase
VGSDAIVESPTYADEICTKNLSADCRTFPKSDRQPGILNGLDTVSFDPQTDPTLATNFNAETLSLRPGNKAALQERVGLPVNRDVPLLGMVSRMDQAKGIDIALKGLKMMAKQDWQLVLLGAGDLKLEAIAKKLQEDLPDRVRVATR